MKARVHGDEGLRSKLATLPDDIRQAVGFEVKRSLLYIEAGAKRRVPVDTGRLRNSITHEQSEDGMKGRVGTNVEYGPYVEHGTRRMRARPYLFPSLEEETPRFKQRVRKAVADTLKRKAARRG
jgi:HK97 gp10 family phage protein